MDLALAPHPLVQFRGRSLMALVLRPEPPIAQWLVGLDALLGRSPGYFTSRPVVADVSALPGTGADLVGLMGELSGRNIRVMALEGADAVALGPEADRLPPMVSNGRPSTPLAPPTRPEPTPAEAALEAASFAPPRPVPSLLIDKPIRSGQSVNFADGDVTILGSVASGAEIVAGGSIHVYGALRGRAMAGFAHKGGRIFCSKLHAELLAIDGIYKTADEIDPGLRGRPVQAWTRDDTLIVATLS